MEFTNSPLVSYTNISPNKTSPRNHAIDTVTIHCVVGQCTVESLGRVFANPERKASSNYGVGKDGKIGMYVEEKDRSWCSSSKANDHRAITIEVASDNFAPYAVTDAAYKGLIDLLVDICRRNGIKKLLWKADKSLIGQVDKQNMTVHRWFAAKSCPGEYLYSLHGRIAEEVNARLVEVKAGDLVSILPNAVYWNGKKVPDSIRERNWYVKSVDEATGRAVIDRSEDGKNAINSAIDVRYLTVLPKDAGDSSEEGPLPEDVPAFTVRLSKEDGKVLLKIDEDEWNEALGKI